MNYESRSTKIEDIVIGNIFYDYDFEVFCLVIKIEPCTDTRQKKKGIVLTHFRLDHRYGYPSKFYTKRIDVGLTVRLVIDSRINELLIEYMEYQEKLTSSKVNNLQLQIDTLNYCLAEYKEILSSGIIKSQT